MAHARRREATGQPRQGSIWSNGVAASPGQHLPGIPLNRGTRPALAMFTRQRLQLAACCRSSGGRLRCSWKAREKGCTVSCGATDRSEEDETTMMAIRKRGKGFHADLVIADVRVRGSLGTRNYGVALRRIHQLETALSEGGTSVVWAQLRDLLPPSTYCRFADVVGVRDRPVPRWADLAGAFKAHLEQRKNIGKLQSSTEQRYQASLREFEAYLVQHRISLLSDITKPVVESFKVWRIKRIKRRKFARGGTGLVLDAAILHRVFAFALEIEMVAKNPVRMEGRPGENPENGAEPFTAHDLARLRKHAADDLLT